MKKILLFIAMTSIALSTSIHAENSFRYKIPQPQLVTNDWDGDGQSNDVDTDDDNDGILDTNDDDPFSGRPVLGGASEVSSGAANWTVGYYSTTHQTEGFWTSNNNPTTTIATANGNSIDNDVILDQMSTTVNLIAVIYDETGSHYGLGAGYTTVDFGGCNVAELQEKYEKITIGNVDMMMSNASGISRSRCRIIQFETSNNWIYGTTIPITVVPK